jgi:hypothetical protein
MCDPFTLVLLLVIAGLLAERSGWMRRVMPSFFDRSRRWRHLSPQDILFWLGFLAALDVVLFWLPLWYWTTYEPGGDDRSGMLLFPAMAVCPVSWVLGTICFWQVWRRHEALSPSSRLASRAAATAFMLVIFSTFVMFVRFFRV